MKIVYDEEGKLRGQETRVETMVRLRQEAADLEHAAAGLKLAADDIFKTMANELKLDAVVTDEGTYRYVSKAGSSKLDQGKLKLYLLEKGVNSDVVADAFKAATKKGKGSEYVAFFPPGADKREEKGDPA